MGGLLDYFSREEGLKRREKLDSAIAEAARYYLGPTGLPERLGLIAEANPVQGVMRSMQAGRDVMSPTATPMERVGATGRMLSEVAAATAPSVAAYKGAIPAAQAVQEGLLGVSAGSKLAAKNFLADESGSVPLGRASADTIESSIRRRFPDVNLSLGGRTGETVTLNKIIVPEADRGAGTGTRVMRELLDQADDTGTTVALTPSADFGGSLPRLKKFYKSLGFVENKGRNKDFSISESMFRAPRGGLLR